jgi:CBS domain containing-hemolysin-like protein
MPLPNGAGYILDAGMNLEDASDLLKLELPRGESDTLGGFIYDQLGKVPEVAEIVNWSDTIFEVLSVSDRRILKVKVTYAPHEQDAQEKAEDRLESKEPSERKPANPVNGPARSTA